MIQKKDILQFIKKNNDYLKKHFHLKKIGLFGSFANDEQTEDSDIDIIIEFEENTNHLFELKQELRDFIGNKFNKKVDIANEKYLRASVKKEILEEVVYID